MQRGKLYAWVLVLVILVSACSRNEPPDNDLKAFTEQKVTWEDCDPSIGEFFSPQVLAVLGDRLECAVVKTPLDWENPGLDSVDMGLLRVKAKDAAKRKGAIAVNPGGPGGDGLLLGAFIGALFATAGDNPDIPVAAPATLKQISSEYDIIGFSPRGTGGGLRHYCGTSTTTPIPAFYTDRSAENLDAILNVSRVVAEACERTPVTKYIDTEQTARDMDLIRILLGDEKLNYLGYSYGSWLGAWYAKLFPQNVGNFVLDSNTDFSSPFSRTFELQPASFQEAFDKVVVPYLVRNNAFFELGATEEIVAKVYSDLPEEIKAVVTFPIVGSLYSAGSIQDIAIILLSARGLNAVYQEDKALVTEDFFGFLDKVDAYTYHSNPEFNSIVASAASSFAFGLESYLLREDASYTFDLDPSYSVFISILCNDGEWNKDKDYWIQKGNEENISNPLAGGNLTDQPCIYWDKSTAKMPAVPGNMPAILLVQSEFDTATNTDGALTAFESLSNAKMIFVEDEYTHGVFPYRTECVDAPVATFLLNGTLPTERRTDCAGLPLPGEEGAGIASLLVKKEKTLVDKVHEIIRRNAIKPLGMRE